MSVLLLLARGAGAGLALFGAVVLALGGASLRLLLLFWALGVLIVLVSPSLRIVSPKVESGRERAIVGRLDRREKLVKLLFDNATEKHGGTVLLYDRLPLPSLDTPELMSRRLRAMEALVDRATIKGAHTTLCGARNCLEGLLDG